MWVLSWVFNLLGSEKLLSQFEHWNGFSPVWVLSCFFKALWSVKLLSHFEHLNGLSPVWALSCLFKWDDLENLLSHFEHLKGFSPVWVPSCVISLLDLEKLLTCHKLCNWICYVASLQTAVATNKDISPVRLLFWTDSILNIKVHLFFLWLRLETIAHLWGDTKWVPGR